MVKLIELLLAVFILFLNLKSYRSLFTTNIRAKKDYEDSLSNLKKELPIDYKGIALIFSTFLVIPSIVFYIIGAITFTNSPILLFFVVLKLFQLFIGWIKMFKVTVTEKFSNRGFFIRIMIPLTTLYTGYYIWFVLNK